MTVVYVDASLSPPRGAWVRIDSDKVKKNVFPLDNVHLTNNEAEYCALCQSIVDHIDWPDQVQIKMDSLLVVNQLNGLYRVRSMNLARFHAQAYKLLKKAEATLAWIPRNQNLAGKLLERTKG